MTGTNNIKSEEVDKGVNVKGLSIKSEEQTSNDKGMNAKGLSIKSEWSRKPPIKLCSLEALGPHSRRTDDEGRDASEMKDKRKAKQQRVTIVLIRDDE